MDYAELRETLTRLQRPIAGAEQRH